MRKVLFRIFFNRSTLQVAYDLLGKFLVRKINGKIVSGMITEVEAYVGMDDKASHASRGRTKRTEVMFGKPGHWYVYMIYGMHYCLNIVTEQERFPAAVLIRSLDVINGPGRVCKYMHIDRKLNTVAISKKAGLWIEDRGRIISKSDIKTGKRIGVDYAGKWKEKPWRFFLQQI